jgi:hypothetical protein
MTTAGRKLPSLSHVYQIRPTIFHRITRAKGSSEYCISHLLAPGAFARMPMVNRVDKLKIPVLFSC